MKEKIAAILKDLLPVNDGNYEYVAEQIANSLSDGLANDEPGIEGGSTIGAGVSDAIGG